MAVVLMFVIACGAKGSGFKGAVAPFIFALWQKNTPAKTGVFFYPDMKGLWKLIPSTLLALTLELAPTTHSFRLFAFTFY